MYRLGRATRAEIAFWLDKHMATILHDFAKFFDSMNIPILIKEAMENVFESKVPLTVDIGEGATWLEAH